MKNIKINEVFEHDGNKYLKISETSAVKVVRMDENGKPVIDVKSEEILHEDGHQDVKITVPTFKIMGETKI